MSSNSNYFNIDNFDLEAQAYVQAWKTSRTKTELFEALEDNPVWQSRRIRLMDRYTMGWYRRETLPSGRTKRVPMTNGEGNPSYYTISKMAKYMHKSLQKKGVALPDWMSLNNPHVNNRVPLADRLNRILLTQ